MQTVQIVFVGIFLFFAENFYRKLGVMATLSHSLISSVGSANSCAYNMPNRHLLFKPHLNTYNSKSNSFSPVQASKSDSKRRNMLTASERKSLSPTFSLDNWKKISQQGSDNFRDLASTFKEGDQLQSFNIHVKKIYENILFLLLHKIQSWLDRDEDLSTIEYYLGYDPTTINLINISMTELLTEKRIVKNANINNLESLFYYSCDIKHMNENKTTVRKKFQSFIARFQLTKQDILQKNVDQLKDDLKQNLMAIGDKTNASFGISIESMKMRIILDSSENEIIKSIRKRIIDPSTNMSVRDLVESYASEFDGFKVNDYHVSILSILIPDIFGYVRNHFELLSKLREYDINENDKIIINEFSTFMNQFMLIFVSRFFELKGEWSQEFEDAMYSVMDFLHISVRELTDEEDSIKHEIDYVEFFAEKKTILNYYNEPERNEVVDNDMKTLMDNAVQQLLATCNGERPDFWENNRWSKIVYERENLSKNNLIELVKSNTCNAFNILNAFCCEFTQKTELDNE